MSEIDFNCECETTSSYQTLAELRTRMMRRLGYSAMAENPPPGMAALIDDFLRDAQTELYAKNPALRTTRFYRWTMTEGQRYYGIRDNDSSSDFTDITCGKHMDPDDVVWVGVEDLNGAWLPLNKGIDPTLYTTALQPGLPACYEIRSCIEVFPAPAYAYKLWIEAKFELEPFEEAEDRTTINDTLVFLYALGNAKLHYGQKDANAVLRSAGSFLVDIKAGKHLTARYVPATVRLPPAIQPIMTEFIPNP